MLAISGFLLVDVPPDALRRGLGLVADLASHVADLLRPPLADLLHRRPAEHAPLLEEGLVANQAVHLVADQVGPRGARVSVEPADRSLEQEGPALGADVGHRL